MENLLARVGYFFTQITVVRGPILVVSASFVAFSIPAQTLEVYRVLVEDVVAPSSSFLKRGGQIGFAALSLIILSFVAWQVAKQLYEAHERQSYTRSSTTAYALWLPRLLAGIPLLGVAIGVWRARAELLRIKVGGDVSAFAGSDIGWTTLALAIAAAVTALLAVLMIWVTGATWLVRKWETAGLNRLFYQRHGRIAVYAAVTLAVFGIALKPVELSRAIGVVPIVCLILRCPRIFRGAAHLNPSADSCAGIVRTRPSRCGFRGL